MKITRNTKTQNNRRYKNNLKLTFKLVDFADGIAKSF